MTDDGYIVDTPTFANLLNNFAIYGDALYKVPQGQTLKALKVYAPPHQYYWAGVDTPAHTALALKNLGFDIVNTPEEADVIVLESDNFDKSLLGLKPTIVVGGTAMQRLEELGVVDGFDAEQLKNGGDYEGLMKAIIDDKDPLTSGYNKNDLFYSNSGNWIAKVPANFKTLASIAGSYYYIAGWWPGNEQLANKIVAISGNYKEQPLFIYAGNPTNRLHTIHFYRWVSNAIFGSQLAQLKDLEKEQKPSTEVVEIINQKPQAGQATTLRYTPQPQIMNATRKAQLPQTGNKESQSNLIIASMFILVSGYLLHLKKKEE